jgi:hypothetical protein
MREILELARQLDIDGPVLLLMAREAAVNSRLRCVEELTADGRRALLADLHSMTVPLAA